jgi:diadenosine tetraphosphate (Ap4A) HIT family hydrolase
MTNLWMPRERWDALVRGQDCPLCGEHRATASANEFGYTIADLRLSRLRLVRNQYVPGYCILICCKHVREPYHLSADEKTAFFEDMVLAAQALENVFRPDKLNFQLLGNVVPHLHVHLVPRYYGDPAPGRPIDPTAQIVTLADLAYTQRVQQIQVALAALQ